MMAVVMSVFQVTYKAPEPKGEHFFAESFDKGTLDGWEIFKAL